MAWDRLRDSYDRVAASYEARFQGELEAKPRDRELLGRVAAAAGDPVVEIGCGPGQVGRFVQQSGRQVVGLDLSPEMAKLAARRLDSALVADMRALPLPTGAVGGILAFYSVIHVPGVQLGLVLSEMTRVLRPGGLVLLAAHEGQGVIERDEFLAHQVPFVASLFTLEALVGAATGVGLQIVLAESRPPYEPEESTTRLHLMASRP